MNEKTNLINSKNQKVKMANFIIFLKLNKYFHKHKTRITISQFNHLKIWEMICVLRSTLFYEPCYIGDTHPFPVSLFLIKKYFFLL